MLPACYSGAAFSLHRQTETFMPLGAQAIWTRDILNQLIAKKMGGHKLIVVANREPYIHRYVEDQIAVIKPASGMATAIDPLMEASRGTWIAHGSGEADRDVVDEFDRICVQPDDCDFHGTLVQIRDRPPTSTAAIAPAISP